MASAGGAIGSTWCATPTPPVRTRTIRVPDAWRYRNWVVDAFNRDLRYDDFIREQIAGDVIHATDDGTAYANGVIATGYLAMSRRFDHDSDKHMHLTFEDANRQPRQGVSGSVDRLCSMPRHTSTIRFRRATITRCTASSAAADSRSLAARPSSNRAT